MTNAHASEISQPIDNKDNKFTSNLFNPRAACYDDNQGSTGPIHSNLLPATEENHSYWKQSFMYDKNHKRILSEKEYFH